ncbi:MAG: hypothetical protein ABI400_04170 [Lacisediminihabitans sp.]
MAGEHEMAPAEVGRLLDELKRRLEEAGVNATIHIFGGSAMALLFPDDPETRFTEDIDAAIQPREDVYRVVLTMADELGLSPTWLNASGVAFLPPRAQPPSTTGGVAVTYADANELIAMKLAASREQDLHDLGMLARRAGITDPQVLVDIAFDAYGEDSVVLSDSRSDYLIMAKDALTRAKRRAQKAKPPIPGD